MTAGFTLFDTALGRCGIAWSERGLTDVQLPEADESATRARLEARVGAGGDGIEPPPRVREAIARIQRHLAGEVQDFRALALDLEETSPFFRRVYEESRNVAAGMTISYGELAARAGSPGGARAVGQAMARNRIPVVIPCHRVLASNRAPGGFSAPGGLTTKQRLLALEGVRLIPPTQRSLFAGSGRLAFDGARARRALAAADPKLARLMERVGPFRLKLEAIDSPFESLAEAIVYQQLATNAAAAIMARARALFGPARFASPQQLLDTSEERLRSAGLSRPKILALKDLAAKTLEGVVPPLEQLERMEDEAIVERLTAVRGIGRWTVEMLLVFRLGRPDVLPATDYGIRKGFARMLGKRDAMPEPADVLRRGERWRPFRSVASWYLWRALELEE